MKGEAARMERVAFRGEMGEGEKKEQGVGLTGMGGGGGGGSHLASCLVNVHRHEESA